MSDRGVRTLLLLVLALSVSGPVATAATESQAEQDIMSVTTLDEVVVTGRLDSLSGLQKALIEAENRFYARWNELNDDDRLDVLCRAEAPTGRRVSRRRCDARVVDDFTHEEAMVLYRSADANVKVRTTDDIRQRVALELKRRTLLLIDQDPELRLALLQRARLQQMYDDTRARKFSGRRVVFD